MNSVRSFLKRVRQPFMPPTVGQRAKSAFPSLIRRCWNTIPNYLTFYILVGVVAWALWRGRHPMTMIEPFHLPPENKEQPLPFSGEAVAGALRDAITSITEEAEGQPLTSPCDFLATEEQELGGLKSSPSSGSFQISGPVRVEVKGISPQSVASAAREVLGTERDITGDVILHAPKAFQLMARANDRGPWITDPKERSLDGLKYASCELAERILGATNKNALAAAWIRRARYDDVMDLYSNLPSDTSDAEALNNLGVALEKKGKTDESIQRLQQALLIRNCYHDMGFGIAKFNHAVLEACFPEAHYNLANALADKKDGVDLAIDEYRKAIKLKSDYSYAYNNLGNAFFSKGDFHNAALAYRKVTRLKPDYANAYNNLGAALHAEEKYGEAIVEYRKASNSFLKKLVLRPDDVVVRRNLASVYSNLCHTLDKNRQHEEAITECNKALDNLSKVFALEPNDTKTKRAMALTHTILGMCQQHMGQSKKAIDEYRQSTKLDPSEPDYHYNLAKVLDQTGRQGEAIAEYRKITERDPDDDMAHTGLGTAFLNNGQTGKAIAEYIQVTNLKPGSAEAHFNLGVAFQKDGQTDKAIAEYRKAIDLKPDYKEAMNCLQKAIAQKQLADKVQPPH